MSGIKSVNDPIKETPAKDMEKFIGDYITLCIYAALEDSNVEADLAPSDPKYRNKLEYHNLDSYKHYSKLNNVQKRDDPVYLLNRFSVSSEMKQLFTFLFKRMLYEFKEITINSESTFDSIVNSLNIAITECYTSHIFNLGKQYKQYFGTNLNNCYDDDWFTQQCKPYFTASTRDYVSEKVSLPFRNFIKAMSWVIAKKLWYNDKEKNLSGEFFMGVLASTGLPQIMLDEMVIRPKKIKTKPVKSVVSSVQATVSDLTNVKVAVNDQTDTVKTDNADILTAIMNI
jgi:hypothetical protein